VDLIKEGSYFKSCILSQGLEQGDGDNMWSLPQRISAEVKNFLKAGKKWFQINATPSINDGISSGSFLNTISKDDLKNLFFRNFNPPKQWTGAKEETHEKLYINDKSVMYSSGHPQNMHLQGPIVNECIVFHNAPNFHAYVETFFNYEWMFGTKAYPGYAPESAADSYIYCGVQEFQKGDGNCCIGNETRIIQNYKVSSLNKLDLCTGVTCTAGQTCDPLTGKCVGGDDKCAGVTCLAGQTCDKTTGKCVGGDGHCSGGCRNDQICNKNTSRCEDNLCAGVYCPGDSQCSKETGLCSGGNPKTENNYLFLFLTIFTIVLIIGWWSFNKVSKPTKGLMAIGILLGVLFLLFFVITIINFFSSSKKSNSGFDKCADVTCSAGQTCDKTTGKCGVIVNK
jgi:hypothetical protein